MKGYEFDITVVVDQLNRYFQQTEPICRCDV